ncbi:MAG: methyltransferase domain-containing protein [Pontixanthobacter sp.]
MHKDTLPTIFAPKRRRAGWRRLVSRQHRDNAAVWMLDDAIDEIIERMAFMRFVPESTLVVGDWTGKLARHLIAEGCSVVSQGIGEIDEEQPFGDMQFDAIVHLLGMGTLNDLPGALLHCRNALKDDGLLFSAFPGAGTLLQLRQIMLAADGAQPAARIHPMIDQKAAAALMQRAGFRKQVIDSQSLIVRFSSLNQLIDDLRDQGMGNMLRDPGPYVKPSQWRAAKQKFSQLADADGKLKETFEMITLTGWK